MFETEELELKKSLAQLREGIISLSAMLNKGHKGTVIFGINDAGKICGLTVGHKTKADITHEIQNNLKPLPISVSIDEYENEGRQLIKVCASGDDTPYSAYGRYYIRIEDADIPMDSSQLQTFFEEKDGSYLKWEEAGTSYGADDIDEDLLLQCVRTANEKGRMNYVYRNAKEALNKFGLLTEDHHLNHAGWYLFGKGKPVTIKEGTFPTDSRTDFGEIREFSGNIFECIREAISYIQNHITYKAQIVGALREEIPEIPVRAIREIVVNSFAHCSYARNGDFNQYVVYRSSVSIYNPGTIIRGIDPLRFASGQVGSKIRNVLIASVLYKYGYIDAFGTGFDRTFSLCAESGVEYRYRQDEFGFTFIFSRNPEFLDDKINDRINDKKEVRAASLDEKILQLMKENKYITVPELSRITGKSTATVYRHITALSHAGRVKRIGSRKSGYWKV